MSFESRRAEHIALMQRLVPEEAAKRRWTLEDFAAERLRRLQQLVAYAKQHSPWHAERLRDVEPGDLTEATLPSLPTMTKAELMAHWDDIVCDRRLNLALAEEAVERARQGEAGYVFNEHQVLASGGSTGTRGVFVWDFVGLARGVALAVRFNQWVSNEVGPVNPVRIAYVQATTPGHGSNLVARCFGDPALPVLHLSPSRPLNELVDELNRFEPTQLVGYPSALHALAEEALAGRLRVRVQRLGGQAEPLLPETRALLTEAFDAPITELYGASECLNLAQGWPGEDFLRLVEDNAVLEPVDDDGSPTPPGRPSSKLFLTNLLNRVLPLIRYELNDEVTLLDGADPSRPGRAMRVAGRRDDVFVYGNATVHPHVLRSILGRRDISEYQVRQTAAGVDIRVRSADSVDLADVTASVERALKSLGISDPEVAVTRADALERHAMTGKLKRFVPLG